MKCGRGGREDRGKKEEEKELQRCQGIIAVAWSALKREEERCDLMTRQRLIQPCPVDDAWIRSSSLDVPWFYGDYDKG